MPTLSEQLKRLVNTSRGRGRLDPAATRESIAASVSTGFPTAIDPQPTETGGGISSPLTETSNSETTYTITSSDGLFSFEIPQQTTYEDALTAEIVVIHKAPT